MSDVLGMLKGILGGGGKAPAVSTLPQKPRGLYPFNMPSGGVQPGGAPTGGVSSGGVSSGGVSTGAALTGSAPTVPQSGVMAQALQQMPTTKVN